MKGNVEAVTTKTKV